MTDVPRSEIFDDVYFSAADGLAETQHVFLDSNNLPKNWKKKPQFTIAETGFGTGLNFLSAWKLFDETSTPDQKLHFISFEKYPLKSHDILKALTRWESHFEDRLSILCDHYPLRIPGFHRINITPNITLTLIFDDINKALPRLNAKIDCWFLDGFKPSTNPDMWSETLFSEMARLSHTDTHFATFTAAGFVKRGLRNAGFTVKKIKGFGTKRDMLTGTFTP